MRSMVDEGSGGIEPENATRDVWSQMSSCGRCWNAEVMHKLSMSLDVLNASNGTRDRAVQVKMDMYTAVSKRGK
jgi:hypothetical protein